MAFYLLQVTLCWAVFALLYVALLRHETFFKANRLYLLVALVLGLWWPLAPAWASQWAVGPSGGVGAVVRALPEFTVGLQAAADTAHWPVLLLNALVVLWVLGAALALARLLVGGWRLSQLIASARCERLPDGQHVWYAAGVQMPFSFFGWVFLPDPNGIQNADNQTDVRLMLAHEQVHARHWHSADVLLLELLSVLLWWHPLVHWYRSTLRTVHEYAADAEVARQFSLKQYGLLLIRHVQSGPAPALVHHFFQSPIKQRIQMLTQQVSSPLRAWKYAAVLPVLALLLSFNTTSAQQSVGASASSGGGASAGVGASASATTPCDSMPQFAGGLGALGKFLATNLKYPETARKAKAEQLVVLQLTIGTDGLVTEAIGVPGKTFRDDLLAEALRVARLTSWQPAQCNGQTFKAKVTLPIRFKLD